MIDAVILVAFAAVFGALAGFGWLWLREARRPRVTCLLYHRFADPTEYERLGGAERVFQVPLDRFERQLRRLVDAGFHFVTADQVADFVAGRVALPQPAVQITIDDGSLSVLERAQPLLQRHGGRATLFLTTDATAPIFAESGERRMTANEVRALDPEIVEVQAHGVTHRPLVMLDDTALREELEGCRADIAQMLGREPDHLAIPGGWYDRRVLRAAAAAGFRGVWVSDAGGNRPGADPLRIRRLNVDGFAGPGEFDALFRPFAVAQRRLFSILKRLPGRLLGPRRWLPLRRRLRGVVRAEALSFRTLRRLAIWLAVGTGLMLAWWFFR